MKIITGSRYIGSFIGNRAEKDSLMMDKVQGCTEAKVTSKHLKSAYAGLQKSLQQEWVFVQRVTPGIGDAFIPVEQAL